MVNKYDRVGALHSTNMEGTSGTAVKAGASAPAAPR